MAAPPRRIRGSWHLVRAPSWETAMGQTGMWLNSEKANVTVERPLYLLTLEEKVGREREELTFLSPQGGGSLRNRAEQGCLWELPVSIALTKGLRTVEMTEDTRSRRGVLGSAFWEPAVQPGPGAAMRSSRHRISAWRGQSSGGRGGEGHEAGEVSPDSLKTSLKI